NAWCRAWRAIVRTQPRGRARIETRCTRSLRNNQSRKRAQWVAAELLVAASGHRPRRTLRRPGARRHVPPLAGISAHAQLDQAIRRCRAPRAGVRALRLEQSAGGRPDEPCRDAGTDGRNLLLSLAAGDAERPGDLRATDRDPRALWLSLG